MLRLDIAHVAVIIGCLVTNGCSSPSTPEKVAASPPVQTGGSVVVIVQRGQSLDQIAKAYQASKSDIIAANHLSPPYTLKPGTFLQVPVRGQTTGTKQPIQSDAATVKSARSTEPATKVKPRAKQLEPIPLD